jgi:uncharacterized membrane protein YgcG
MAFLDESHRTQEAARRAREEERRAKLRRARITAAVLGTAAVVTLIFGLFAVRAGYIARRAEKVAQKEAQTATAVTDFMVGLFDVVDPEAGRGSSVTAREILDQGAESIDTDLADEPEVQARMKRAVGKVYGSLGLYEEALPMLTQALETAEETWGPDHPETHATRHRLAEMQWYRCRIPGPGRPGATSPYSGPRQPGRSRNRATAGNDRLRPGSLSGGTGNSGGSSPAAAGCAR